MYSEAGLGKMVWIGQGMEVPAIAVVRSQTRGVVDAGHMVVVDNTDIAKIAAPLAGRIQVFWEVAVVGDRLDGQIVGSHRRIGLKVVGLRRESIQLVACYLEEGGNSAGCPVDEGSSADRIGLDWKGEPECSCSDLEDLADYIDLTQEGVFVHNRHAGSPVGRRGLETEGAPVAEHTLVAVMSSGKFHTLKYPAHPGRWVSQVGN